MNTNLARRTRHGFLFGLLIVVLTFSIVHETAGAETSWWQKGINLFKDLGGNGQQTELTLNEIGAALKDALRVGTETVTSRLLGKQVQYNRSG